MYKGAKKGFRGLVLPNSPEFHNSIFTLPNKNSENSSKTVVDESETGLSYSLIRHSIAAAPTFGRTNLRGTMIRPCAGGYLILMSRRQGPWIASSRIPPGPDGSNGSVPHLAAVP